MQKGKIRASAIVALTLLMAVGLSNAVGNTWGEQSVAFALATLDGQEINWAADGAKAAAQGAAAEAEAAATQAVQAAQAAAEAEARAVAEAEAAAQAAAEAEAAAQAAAEAEAAAAAAWQYNYGGSSGGYTGGQSEDQCVGDIILN
ncbi:MAG: hypothetical protein FWG24_02415 [Eggerthellaceae bacterium]|nr:hypothetical protein [Eggerthellaceae bacterium]